MKLNYYQKILLSVFALIFIVFIAYSAWHKKPGKTALSNVTSHTITLPYKFKNKEAEQLSHSAWHLKKDGDYEQAIDLYHKAIQLENDNPRLYFDLAESYARNDDLEHAITSLNSAIIFDSTYATFYCSRGLYYYLLYDYDKAINDLEKAVALDPKSPSSYYNLALAYHAANRDDQACNAFGEAKLFGIDSDGVSEQKPYIELNGLCK